MKMAAKSFLFHLFMVVAASLREPTTQAATALPQIIVRAQCLNGGTYDGMRCICPDMFYGPLCETIRDNIVSPQCLNGGTYDGMRCICPDMFYGPLCETIRDNIPLGQCQNGGVYDGIKCICRDSYSGPLCEFYAGEIITRPTFVAKMNVEIRFNNLEFRESLTNPESEEYMKFTTDFKTQMRSLYFGVPGYKDVTILEIKPGSVNVNHDVLVDLQYTNSISDDYWLMFNNVVGNIISSNVSKDDPWYFGSCSMTPEPLPTIEEVCWGVIPEGLKEFYDPVLTPDGLLCVSHCNPLAANYLSCNGGSCELSYRTGPTCFCPNTDSYIYTQQRCTGKISKMVLCVSVGVPIGVLLILLVILGIFYWRTKNKVPEPLTEEEPYYSNITK